MQIPDQVDRAGSQVSPVHARRARRRWSSGPTCSTPSRKGDILLHHPFQSFKPVIDFIEQAAQGSGRGGDQADGVSHRRRLRADAHPDRRGAARQGDHRGGGAAGALRRGGQHQLGRAARGGRRARGLRRRRPQDPRQARHGGAPRRRTGCAATATSAPATITRAPRRCTPTSACSRATRTSAPTSTMSSCSSPAWAKPASCATCGNRPSRCTPSSSPRSSARPMHAKAGKKAGIIAKMNALLEPEIIAALYEASKAGVKIDLIVRGVCAPAAGRAGAVGEHPRALDHRPLPRASSRLLTSTAPGNVYLSSADWMERNFFRRIEVCLPGPRPEAEEARDRGRPEEVPGRQRAGLGDAPATAATSAASRANANCTARSSSCCRSWPARNSPRRRHRRARSCGRSARRRRRRDSASRLAEPHMQAPHSTPASEEVSAALEPHSGLLPAASSAPLEIELKLSISRRMAESWDGSRRSRRPRADVP